MPLLGKVVKSPDYVSAIVGYRSWKYDGFGLTSLNNSTGWEPGKELKFYCPDYYELHPQPDEYCSCGIYAAKSLEILAEMNYTAIPAVVWGEVKLWGKVIEHDLGYRAEFAYPKNVIIPFRSLPFYLRDIENKVKILSKYVDLIQTQDHTGMVPLWEKDFGVYQTTVDKILNLIQEKWCRVQAATPHRPQLGERIWVRSFGAGIITEMGRGNLTVTSSHQKYLIDLDDIKFINNRWETDSVILIVGRSR